MNRTTHRVATLASRSGTGKVLYRWPKTPLPTAQERYERAVAWFIIDVILVAIALAGLIVVCA